MLVAALLLICLTVIKAEQPGCFKKLKGKVDECYCNIQDVDTTHEIIFSNLAELMKRDYYRYYKVNLHKGCLFWENMGECRKQTCALKTCGKDEVPEGIITHKNKSIPTCEEERELSKIHNVISEAGAITLKNIENHNSIIVDFCVKEDEESENSVFYDLLQNPERFTGYSGEESHRIWRSIYNENCFKPKKDNFFHDLSHKSISHMCREKRVFFRAISGLHSSISIHLAAKYPTEDLFGTDWGRNVAEFSRRFMPESTGGEGPHWLRNLYFVFALEMRAIIKAIPIWQRFNFFTGNFTDDSATKAKTLEIVDKLTSCPDNFDEAELFKGLAAESLKSDFLTHFRNISMIMDCVTCDKCRLWGKLQTRGLGTALKILFSAGDVEELDLERGEVISLFNGFNQLSHSLRYIKLFRQDLEGVSNDNKNNEVYRNSKKSFFSKFNNNGEL